MSTEGPKRRFPLPVAPEPTGPRERADHEKTTRTALGELRAFVQEARQSATLRTWLLTVVDVLLGAGAVVALGAVLAALTLRGDVLAPLVVAAFVAWGLGLVIVRVQAMRRRFGDELRAARTISRVAAPLSHGASAEDAKRQRLLRHELLGALELGTAPPRESLHAGFPAGGRSPALVAAYLADVARRLRGRGIDPTLALPRVSFRSRAWAAAIVAFGLALTASSPRLLGGLALLIEATDARPTPPPEPVWSTLAVELVYPEHTGRPSRWVPNPSGALRVVAGTKIGVVLEAHEPARAGRVVLSHDSTELRTAAAPEVFELEAGTEPRTWTGSFVVRGGGTWTIVLEDDRGAQRRSPALPLQLEVDRPPDVELLPLPQARREVGEREQVDVRFHARDDFGLRSAELVYQLPGGVTHRLPVGEPVQATRTWRHRFTWDISEIPIAERSEVLYWIEVRDNDPGLGLEPLPDPPGKRVRSATMRLTVRDDESEHAANIAKVAGIRDAAVDLLAARMTTRAFVRAPVVPDDDVPPLPLRAEQARALLGDAGKLLAMLAGAIDALAMDSLSDQSDAATLTGIHRRLTELHRLELAEHETIPPGSEGMDPVQAASELAGMASHNRREIAALEDEIIRLDDLVDGQVIERIEALVARLEATQRKIVEELEQLRAGDESARARIEQLELRRRDDLRRLAEARAMLQREVEEEFMNLDAFKILEQMAEREQLSTMLRDGKIDDAIERMRQQLGELEQLRDRVQRSIGEDADGMPAISEEERRRMQLLRELSRLQDEQGNVRAETRALHEEWRARAGEAMATEATTERAREQARALREALERINDARLGRDARRALEDGKRALEELEAAPTRSPGEGVRQLELAEIARRALQATRAAEAGAAEHEQEGQALERTRGRLERLVGELERRLGQPSALLDAEALERLEALERRQEGLRARARTLLGDEIASAFPPNGRRALRQAERDMQRSTRELDARVPRQALEGEGAAWDDLQEAIDSLRRASPPPPAASGSDEASTEAERDRSLRDQLMDAMREGTPDQWDEPVKRYYEELLR